MVVSWNAHVQTALLAETDGEVIARALCTLGVIDPRLF